MRFENKPEVVKQINASKVLRFSDSKFKPNIYKLFKLQLIAILFNFLENLLFFNNSKSNISDPPSNQKFLIEDHIKKTCSIITVKIPTL